MTGPTARRLVGWIGQGMAALVVVALLIPTPFGKLSMSVVDGDSMSPTLADGSLAIVRTAPSYGVGDIVVYDTGQGGVIHRIVSFEADGTFRTRGDNRQALDRWTPTVEHIRGRTFVTVPIVGGVVRGMQNRLGVNGLAVIAGVLFMLGLRSGGRVRRRVAPTGETNRLRAPGDHLMVAAAAALIADLALALAILRTPETSWVLLVPRDALWRLVVFVAPMALFGMVAGLAIGLGINERFETWRTDLAFGRRLVDVNELRQGSLPMAIVPDAAALVKAADVAQAPVLRLDRATEGIRYAVATQTTLLVFDIAVPAASPDARAASLTNRVELLTPGGA